MSEMVAATELVRHAKAAGIDLTGPDGLPKQSTKTVLETALNKEMTEYLGREKHGSQPKEQRRTHGTVLRKRPF